jgi:SAM-dependent methyltransferase
MRERLAHPPFDYQTLRNNMGWFEHRVRLGMIAGAMASSECRSVLDPAAGDGSLEELAERLFHFDWVVLGDISQPNVNEMIDRYGDRPGWRFACGDIMDIIADGPPVDLIVLSEILEHLEDPDAVLRAARDRAGTLIASSPVMRPGQVDDNPEHLWMFDRTGYRDMLQGAGWRTMYSSVIEFPPASYYDFQLWVCKV